MKYATILKFNGRVGGRTVQAETVEAESIGDALELVIAMAVRSRAGGGSIFVTGVTIEEAGQ